MPDSNLSALLSKTNVAARRELEGVADLEERLAAIDVVVRRQWAQISVNRMAFFEHVGRHLPEENALAALGRLHVTDLYLAFACAQHDVHAMTHLERVVLPPIYPAVARVTNDVVPVEDVIQVLMTKLLTDDAREEPKLLQYSGRGPLAAWLRVAAVRAALSLRRKKVDEPKTGEELLARVPESGGADPEIVHLRARYASEFETAFSEAMQRLEMRERNLLYLHFVEGLTTDQIGLTYSVHGATAARWIGRARQQIFSMTKDILAARLNLSTAEFQSLVGLLLSQLDVSIRHLLGVHAPPDLPEG